jgi:putative transposase
LHRPVEGKIKTGIIKKQAEQYYVCFSVEFTPEFLEPTGHNVGLDMGISKLVITSDGQFFPQPKYLRQMEAKLRCAQRKVARRQKGSNRRRKAVLELQKLHQHVANQRRDMAHKIARELVNSYDLIAMEDLNIKGMVRNHHLAKSISDASWNTFMNVLTGKAEEAGRQAVKVDPKYTSQICSGCGEIVKKGLSVRIHECPHCNLVLDRDVNAAINILQRALG